MSLDSAELQTVFEAYGLASYLSSSRLEALTRFTHKMLEINEHLNLTRWTADNDVLNFHLLDSALVLPTLKPLIGPFARWVDLGTGCGFPGSVVLGAFPDVEVTLLDSVGKKVKALEECMAYAGLQGVGLVGRVEDLGQNALYRERYDGVIARAVADFPILLEYALPLLKVGGYLVDWMTQDQVNRLKDGQKALQTLGGEVIQTVDYLLPGSAQKRFYTVVRKTSLTPPAYPRPAGQPSKHPL